MMLLRETINMEILVIQSNKYSLNVNLIRGAKKKREIVSSPNPPNFLSDQLLQLTRSLSKALTAFVEHLIKNQIVQFDYSYFVIEIMPVCQVVYCKDRGSYCLEVCYDINHVRIPLNFHDGHRCRGPFNLQQASEMTIFDPGKAECEKILLNDYLYCTNRRPESTKT